MSKRLGREFWPGHCHCVVCGVIHGADILPENKMERVAFPNLHSVAFFFSCLQAGYDRYEGNMDYEKTVSYDESSSIARQLAHPLHCGRI